MKNEGVITLMELQGVLGAAMRDVLDKDKDSAEHAEALATAANIYAGARNIIHNASTIMRAKEILAEGKIKDVKAINDIVG